MKTFYWSVWEIDKLDLLQIPPHPPTHPSTKGTQQILFLSSKGTWKVISQLETWGLGVLVEVSFVLKAIQCWNIFLTTSESLLGHSNFNGIENQRWVEERDQIRVRRHLWERIGLSLTCGGDPVYLNGKNTDTIYPSSQGSHPTPSGSCLAPQQDHSP